MRPPRYHGLTPASTNASAAARSASRKSNTKFELVLRRAIWRAGLRYRANVSWLPGKPDLVFKRARVAVFCDGDFWHGKDWPRRKQKLLRGTNGSYWVAKIESNMVRDRNHTESLERDGWTVLRFWESEILRQPERAVRVVLGTVASAGARGARHRDAKAEELVGCVFGEAKGTGDGQAKRDAPRGKRGIRFIA
jgi:DNA mismatch endonuclease (patch repair protein)